MIRREREIRMIRGQRSIAAGLTVFAVVAGAGAAPAARFEASVSKVIDGDSLWLRPAGKDKPVEVRLQDIDAPEICQAWGRQAREALEGLVANKTLVVQPRAHDAYGRLLVVLSIDGTNVGSWMVTEGHAWSIRTKWDRGPLVKEERVAASLRRGLWSELRPVQPKEFRRSHGACEPGEAAAPGAPSASPANATPIRR